MPKHYNVDSLRAFAEKKIAAEKYPSDYHVFRTFECDACGKTHFSLVIEPHTGSTKGNFKGVIIGVCHQCQESKKLFSFTGDHRQPLPAEKAVCSCGNDTFYAAMCERYEGDEGVMGFFDEGVIVGQCTSCGKNQAFVFTD
jgi:hypothetical protein